jgi:hypothetical protein
MPDSLPGALANGLLSGVGSKVAGEIISAVMGEFFPDDQPPVYFDAVYAAITAIVEQTVEADTITQINGALTGIEQSMAIDYFPAKASKNLNLEVDRTTLQGILSTIESVFTSGAGGMIGTLQQPSYAAAALPVFMVAAGEHLAILQEMAVIDPDNQAAGGNYRPAASSPTYATPVTGSIAVAAALYAGYAATQWQSIQSTRQAQISSAYIDTSQQWLATITDGGTTCYLDMLQDVLCMTVWENLNYGVGQGPQVSNALLTSTALTIQDTTTGNMYGRQTTRTVTGPSGAVLFDDVINTGSQNPYADPILTAMTAAYQAQAQTNLVATLNDPEAVIQAWLLLVNEPMASIPAPPATAAVAPPAAAVVRPPPLTAAQQAAALAAGEAAEMAAAAVAAAAEHDGSF